jgi:hypothetical protein
MSLGQIVLAFQDISDMWLLMENKEKDPKMAMSLHLLGPG